MEPDEQRAGPRLPPLRELIASDAGRAAGLAAAVMVANVVGLAFTIVFARVLGSDGYGSLAALVATFLILSIPGQALQLTVAREVSSEVGGHDPGLGANVRRWTIRLLGLTLAAAGLSLLLRDALASAIGVDESWAAAATLPTGCLWLLLSLQRGVLQGLGAYRIVGASIVAEALARLALGGVLVAAGADVTGAFLGTGASIAATSLLLASPLRSRLRQLGIHTASATRRLREVLGVAWAPLVGLALVAALQNLDVIIVRHQAATDAAASSYAAASVAAKMIIWVAVGLALYLLPEAARRSSAGRDGRPLLGRTLGLIALVAIPMVAFYAVAGRPLLAGVFGSDLDLAAGALPWLGLAMSLLACAYLSVQFLLALGRVGFLWLLGVAALLEPLLLPLIGSHLTRVALVLLGIQLLLAAGVVSIGFRATPRPALASSGTAV